MVMEKTASLARVSAARIETLAFMEACAGKNLSAYRFPHPFMGGFTVYNWFSFIGYHQIRHAKQIRELAVTFQS